MRSEEDPILERRSVEDANVILDFASISDLDVEIDVDILPDNAFGADANPFPYLNPLPDSSIWAYRCLG